MPMLSIGIDVSKGKSTVCGMKPGGEIVYAPFEVQHTVLFPLDTSIPILSMGIPSFLIKYCNASAPAYYDSIWFVTRTRHSRSNLLN